MRSSSGQVKEYVRGRALVWGVALGLWSRAFGAPRYITCVQVAQGPRPAAQDPSPPIAH